MMICMDCGAALEDRELVHVVERHGQDTPPYEEYDACPYCYGGITEAAVCGECGGYVETGTIRTVRGMKVCAECLARHLAEEEDYD